jgi:hypothetical protein
MRPPYGTGTQPHYTHPAWPHYERLRLLQRRQMLW